MNTATYLAFVDELEKIATTKEAGLLRDIGMRIAKSSGNAARAARAGVQGGIQNAGNAVSAFSTPIDSLKRGLKASTTDFKSMGKMQKGLMGVGLLASGHEALAKNDPLGQGRGRIERASTAVGDQLGGLIGTPFGIAGGFVAGQIGRKAGSVVGKGIEAVRQSRKKPDAPPASP